MTISIRTGAAASIAVGLLVGLALTGCSGTPSPGPSASTSTCASSTAKPASTTAVLEQGGSGTTYDGDHALVLDAAKAAHDRVIVGGVGFAGYVNTVLVGTGPNDLFKAQNLKCRTAAVSVAISSIDGAKHVGTLDPIQALQSLGDSLAGTTSKSVNVVMFANGKNDSGPVRTTPAALDHPQSTINALAKQGLLPACAGWKGYIVTSANGITGAKLREFYRELLARCGGKLVFWGPHLTEYPLHSDALPAADTGQIKVNTSGTQTVLTVSADALFDAGGEVVLDRGTSVLTAIASRIESTTGTVTVRGYTDVGPGRDDVALGRIRATAVIGWLTSHGIAEGRFAAPQSAGSGGAVYPHPTTAAERAANRRVVITVGSAQ